MDLYDTDPALDAGNDLTGPDQVALKAAARHGVPFPEEADRRAAATFGPGFHALRMLWYDGLLDLFWNPARQDFALRKTDVQSAAIIELRQSLLEEN